MMYAMGCEEKKVEKLRLKSNDDSFIVKSFKQEQSCFQGCLIKFINVQSTKKKTLLLLKSALKMDLTKEHDRESQRQNTKFKNKSTQTVLSLVVLVVWCWLTTTFFLSYC